MCRICKCVSISVCSIDTLNEKITMWKEGKYSMSHTHGSIERLKQALMMLCTHLIYGICSGENGIYWMERGGEKSQHICVSQREAMLEQFRPTLERVIITDRNWWCLFRFQLIRSLGYWCTTYCLSQRKRQPNSRNFPPARDDVSRFAIPIHVGNAADQQANLWSLIGRSDECDHDRSGCDQRGCDRSDHGCWSSSWPSSKSKEGTSGLLCGTGLLGAYATQPCGWDEFFGGFNPHLFDGIWTE